jgi:hypothetical protein
MSNLEIVSSESMLRNFPYNGENLFTFKEWLNRGMIVQKGEKAFIKTKLWQKTIKKDKETGEIKNYFVLVNANLFTENQVKPIENKRIA